MDKQYYKTILDGKTSSYGDHKWIMNKWYQCEGELKLCGNGFHASELIQDAMVYVRPGYVCKVEVRGDVVHGDDKSCFREMRIVKAYKWTKKDSVALAIECAEQVLSIYEAKYPKDMRVRDAIKAAKKWLKTPNKTNADAADAAANAADAAARTELKLKIHNWIVKRCGL
jgi:hypothetical protein